MKNATKYTDALKSLVRSLTKKSSVPEKKPMDPLQAFIRGILGYDVPDERVEAALEVIRREFVDLNELRVATELELQEMIGPRYPDIENRVTMAVRCLTEIFNKEHTLKLDRVAGMSRRDQRAYLKDLTDLHPYADGYTMLIGFDSPAMPLDSSMLAFLQHKDCLPADISLEDAQKFIESHLKSEELYPAYTVLRPAALKHAEKPKKKR